MVKRFLITSAQASYTTDKEGNEIPFGSRTGLKRGKAKPHTQFLNGLKTMSKETGAKLMILPIAGRCAKEDILHEEFDGLESICNNSVYRLNKNIQIRDIVVPPQNKDPTTGKRELTGKYDSSIIFPHSKQRYSAVPTFSSELPRYLYTPGAVTIPNYDTSNHRGDTAEREHVLGALLVEIIDDEFYNIRNIRALKNGKFVDLGKEFNGNSNPKKMKTDSIVLGDYHWGNHDKKTIQANNEMIEYFNPEKVFIHDFFDGHSINPHEKDNKMTRVRNFKRGRLNLEDEISAGSKELNRLGNEFKDIDFYLVSSNHNNFLTRYINSGDWIKDIWNSEISSYLFNQSNKLDLPENQIDDAAYLLKTGYSMKGDLPKNIKFLKLSDSLKRYGYQLASHGDKGSSGKRGGSAKARAITSGGKSITGHCFSEDTEILTKNGWKFYGQLNKMDLVATMNQKTRLVEWQNINQFFRYNDYKELTHIKSKSVDLLITDKHGLFYVNGKGLLKKTTPIDIGKVKGHINFITTIKNNNKNNRNYSREEIRLLIWILSDGCIEEQKSVRWHLKKQRKITRLINLLDKLNLKYSYNKQNKGTTKIRLCNKDSEKYIKILTPNKIMPEWFIHVSKEECDIILEEYSHTDGTKYINKNIHIQISSSKETEIDILQAMCTINGIRSSKNRRKQNNFTLSLTYNRPYTRIKKTYFTKEKYSGFVWCVNVDNGSLIVRRNGHTIITQNTHTLEIYGNTYVVGTSSKLNQKYTAGYGNAIIGGNAVLYKNGTIQLIPIIEGKWKAKD